MKISLINPTVNGSNDSFVQLPLSILDLGDALTGNGHQVGLIDAQRLGLSGNEVAARVRYFGAQIVVMAQPESAKDPASSIETLQSIKGEDPSIITVYETRACDQSDQFVGENSPIDFVICADSKSEDTTVKLLAALESITGQGQRFSNAVDAAQSQLCGFADLVSLPGIAYQTEGGVVTTPARHARPSFSKN